MFINQKHFIPAVDGTTLFDLSFLIFERIIFLFVMCRSLKFEMNLFENNSSDIFIRYTLKITNK